MVDYLARDLGRDHGLANATELTQKGRLDGSCMNLVYCLVSVAYPLVMDPSLLTSLPASR